MVASASPTKTGGVFADFDRLDQAAADRLDHHRLTLELQRRLHDRVLGRVAGVDEHPDQREEQEIDGSPENRIGRTVEQRRRLEGVAGDVGGVLRGRLLHRLSGGLSGGLGDRLGGRFRRWLGCFHAGAMQT